MRLVHTNNKIVKLCKYVGKRGAECLLVFMKLESSIRFTVENFAECEVIADTVDALIEAGIGDVSELQKKLDAYRISYTRFFYELTSNKKFIEKVIKTSWGCKMQIFEDFLEKAERELQQETKDETRHRCY